MPPTSEAGSATGSEDGAFRALEALVEDARRTCESRDARIASLLFEPPPALPAREPLDVIDGLQQQAVELQAVLQEKEACMQALRLRATFTQPEEARLECRRLLQESVRLQLELRAKRAQRDSRSARDADVQRLERLRGMHSALQEEQAARRQRRGQEEERATSGWDALQRCAGQLTQGIEQLEQVRGAARNRGRTSPRGDLPCPPPSPSPAHPPSHTRSGPATYTATVAGSQEADAALGAHEAQRRSEDEQARAALKEQQAVVAELEKEWADVARKVGDERTRIASSQSEVMQRKEAIGREIAERQLAGSSLRHESAALKQRLAGLQSSLDKVEKDTREVEWRMQQRAGSAAGVAAATAAAAVPPAPPASSIATATAAAPPLASASQLRPSSAPVAAAVAAAGSEQKHKPQVAKPATARARHKDVSAMTDNEKYYYYRERNKGRLDLDRPDLGVGVGVGGGEGQYGF